MRIYTFNELSEIIRANQDEDPDYCNRIAARFVSTNLRRGRDNQDAADIIFMEPEVWPESEEWSIYLQGVAEILMNSGVKPSYEVSWVTDRSLPEMWGPGASTPAAVKRYSRSTPPEMRKRNIIIGDGIIKAV